MESTLTNLEAFLVKMGDEGVPDLAVRSFSHYYQLLVQGETGLIGEDGISPIEEIPNYDTLGNSYASIGNNEVSRTAILKLNGGLGTSMGLKGAKSLLQVRDNLSFLDIIARQAIHWDISLVLMNSFSTAEESQRKIGEYKDLKRDIPFDFLQHKIPKIDQKTLLPVEWPAAPGLEWCPPGHGDIYNALVTRGMLERLQAAGIEYVFVSNSDNLGAVIDPVLLGYFCQRQLPFMMEVADRTEADRKGGHLAVDRQGGFLLRESAQCPAEDLVHFQNVERHRYFNTNNLWINLKALQAKLQKSDGVIGLPMIRNAKPVNPRNLDSAPVYQLETAMGAAISVFEGAGAIRVPRTRFAPVKTTNELLAVKSDTYVMHGDFTLAPHPDRQKAYCAIDLDRAIYARVDEMEKRFPFGSPSLLDCDRLQITGDVHFGENVVCQGEVVIRNLTPRPMQIEANQILSGVIEFRD